MIVRSTAAVLAGLLLAGCTSSGEPLAPVPSSVRVDRYVAIVNSAIGVRLPRWQVVSTGRMFCRSLRSGATSYPELIHEAGGLLGRGGLSARQVKVFVDASIVTLCPEQKPS